MKAFIKIFLIIVVTLTASVFSFNKVVAQTTSPKSYTSGTTSGWTNPTNMQQLDGNYCNLTSDLKNSSISSTLTLKGFGFNVPSNASIIGIEVKITRKSNTSNSSVYDNSLKLINASSIAVGDNKALTSSVSSNKWGTTFATKTYGSSSDNWNSSLTWNDVNNSNFGIQFNVTNTSNNDSKPQIDFVSITITYSLNSISGNIISENQNICSGSTASQISTQIGSTLSGGTGSYTYKWLSSTDNTTYSYIASATSVNYSPGQPQVTTYYKREVTSDYQVNTSSPISVTVNPASVVGSITGAATVCTGTNSTTLTLSGNTGTVQWQSSSDNSTFNNISGSTAQTYTATDLTATTYYRAIVTSGVCSSAISSSQTITVRQNGEWIGLHPSDNNWKNTTNWCGGLPNENTNVVLYAGNPMTFPDVTTPDDALCKSLTIMSGSKILFSSTGAGRLRIFGDLTNNSGSDAIDPTYGTVTFEGASNQTIGGTNSLTFTNLNINSAGNVSLAVSSSVNGSLGLTKGNVITSSTNLLTLSNGASFTGGGSNSMVVGPLKRIGSGSSSPFSVVFPIAGIRGTYQPVTIKHSVSSTNLAFTVTYNEVAHTQIANISGDVKRVSSYEYWDITPSINGLNQSSIADAITLTLPYSTGSSTAYFKGSKNNYRIGHFNGTSWELASLTTFNSSNLGLASDGSANSESAGSVTMSGINTFSPFTMVSIDAAALPVTLSNFSAKAGLNNTVNLAWATSTEIVNKGFRIERQSAIGNGKFENVGFVASKAAEGGNSNVPLYYSFVDVAPASNATNYYRLAQVDLDGKTTYSDVKLVRIGGETVTMVYPNPSNGAVNISRTANNNKMNIQILDMSGRMVQQYSNVTDANFKLNINKAGMYNIKMIYPQTGEQTIQRIVVQK